MTDLTVDRYAENGVDFTSSSIDLVAYDRETKALFIEFVSGYSVYRYDDVEESTFNLFVEADSLNRFWREHLSGDSTNIGDADFTLREPVALVANPAKERYGDGQPMYVEGYPDLTVDTSTIGLSKFGVKYTLDHDVLGIQGPFEASFDAMSEADALAQFAAALEDVKQFVGGSWENAEIKEVTHYFV